MSRGPEKPRGQGPMPGSKRSAARKSTTSSSTIAHIARTARASRSSGGGPSRGGETDAAVRQVLEAATHPLTAGEINVAIGKSERTNTRPVLKRIGVVSRRLNVDTGGAAPVGFALTDDVLAKAHPGESDTPRPARKSSRRSAARGRTTARSTTRARRTNGAVTFEVLPYDAGDNAIVLVNTATNQLYVARPLVEAQ